MNTIPDLSIEHTLGILVLATILMLGSARLARLISFDSYPPSVWLRVKWDDLTHKSSWNPLLHCAYCLTPWIVLINGGIGWATDWHLAWMIFNGWLGVSYLAAMTVAYDGDDE